MERVEKEVYINADGSHTKSRDQLKGDLRYALTTLSFFFCVIELTFLPKCAVYTILEKL